MPGLKTNAGAHLRHGKGIDDALLERLDGARAQWGELGPDEVLFSRVFWSCELCGAALGSSMTWPSGLHPCDCGEWHLACVGCFASKCADPRDNLDYGRCRRCPDAIKVGYAVMGWR